MKLFLIVHVVVCAVLAVVAAFVMMAAEGVSPINRRRK